MTDEQALLAAIWDRPHDDLPRLVYADWLDDTGRDPARAEFIRVQCEQATLDEGDPKWARLDEWRARLWADNKTRWVTASVKRYDGRDLLRVMTNAQRREALFDRGFPTLSLRDLTPEQLVRVDNRRLRHAPLWRYHYGITGDYFDALLAWPHLHKLELFSMRPPTDDLGEWTLPDGWAERMAGCDGLRNVTELALLWCQVTAADLETLLDAWRGRTLRTLDLNNFGNGDAVIAALARHPATAGLRTLRATGAGITAEGIEAMVDGPYLKRLNRLVLVGNRFGNVGVRHLLRWQRLPMVQFLSVSGNGISPRVADDLYKRLDGRVHCVERGR